MGYDQRYDSVCKYTEDGINQSRDYVIFLKKRHAIETEYTKAMNKLCKETQKQKRSSKSKSSSGMSEGDKASIQGTNLMTGIYDIIEETMNICNAHEKISNGLATSILDQTKYIKEMEQTRKEHLDEGFKITKQLQDQYTALKKAKTEYDDAQKICDDATEKSIVAQNTPSIKEKELEKLETKASQAKEKAQKLFEIYNETESQCKIAQENYYKKDLPNLLKRFTDKELERENVTKKHLQVYCELESSTLLEKTTYTSTMTEKIDSIDIEEDIQELISDHVEGESLASNVSVRSLINPLKAGRLLKHASENEWRTRYCVLMGEEQLLYLFESENSIKPKSVIEMKSHTVHAIDDSLCGRPFGFNVVSVGYNPKKDEAGLHLFVCENEDEKLEWVRCLRAHDATSHFEQGKDDFKIIRSLKVEIVEGRQLPNSDLIRRSLDPYCVLSLNQIKQAKTVVKFNSDAPFFGETFYFDDLHPRFENMTCTVFSQSRIRIQKDTELGKVHLSFNRLEYNKQYEEWYPLLSPNSVEGEHGSITYPKEGEGALRLKITLSEEKLFPMETYQEFLQALTEPEMKLIRQIGEVISKDKEEIARRSLRIFSTSPYGAIDFVRALTYYEIYSTDDPNIIFRGNSLATKAVDQYMKMVGSRYLSNTLKNLAQAIYKETQSCEVDPTRVDKPDELKKNWKRLLGYVTSFWETISNSADKCPWELKMVFHYLQADVMAKFNDEKVKYTAIAGFIFLRFFCPAILDPKLFGMANEHPDPSTGRTFTLIAKTIQNLANLVEFGAKEPYMADMNSFITKNIDAMKSCLDKFSTLPKNDLPPTVTLSINLRRELASLYRLLGKLPELNEANNRESLTQLSQLLSDISTNCTAYESSHPQPPQPSFESLIEAKKDHLISSPILTSTTNSTITPTISVSSLSSTSSSSLLSPTASNMSSNSFPSPPPKPVNRVLSGNFAANNMNPPPPNRMPPLPPQNLSTNNLPQTVNKPTSSPKPADLPPKPKLFPRSKSLEKIEDLPIPKNPPPVAQKSDLMKELASRARPKPQE